MTSDISGLGTWTDGGLLQWILHHCTSCVSVISHRALNTVCSLFKLFYDFSPPSPTFHIEATPYLSWITLFSDLFHMWVHTHMNNVKNTVYVL